MNRPVNTKEFKELEKRVRLLENRQFALDTQINILERKVVAKRKPRKTRKKAS